MQFNCIVIALKRLKKFFLSLMRCVVFLYPSKSNPFVMSLLLLMLLLFVVDAVVLLLDLHITNFAYD